MGRREGHLIAMQPHWVTRLATLADRPAIEQLITTSVRALSAADYSIAQVEGALDLAMGLDTQLIEDQTYFVIEDAQRIVACGGWSFRQTLFGNDNERARDADVADPAQGAAKIRAFFVAPTHARRGLGTALMQRCEAEARGRGYRRLELMATLPGQRLYARHGFEAGEAVEYPLAAGLTIRFVPMTRVLE